MISCLDKLCTRINISTQSYIKHSGSVLDVNSLFFFRPRPIFHGPHFWNFGIIRMLNEYTNSWYMHTTYFRKYFCSAFVVRNTLSKKPVPPPPRPNDREPMITFMLQTLNVFQLRTQARNEAVRITRGGEGFHPHIFNISITQSSIGVAAWPSGVLAWPSFTESSLTFVVLV